MDKTIVKCGTGVRLVSADQVKQIICKYENHSIQKTMVLEIEELPGVLATEEQMLEVIGSADIKFD